MWSVLRRHQGVDPEEFRAKHSSGLGAVSDHGERQPIAAGDAIVKNQRTIALHEWREHPVAPRVDILSTPYDRDIYPKLVRAVAMPETMVASYTAEYGQVPERAAREPACLRREALTRLLALVERRSANVQLLLRVPKCVAALAAAAAHTTAEAGESEDEAADTRALACAVLRHVARLRPDGLDLVMAEGKDEPLGAGDADDAYAERDPVLVEGGRATTTRYVAALGVAARRLLTRVQDPVPKVSAEALRVLHAVLLATDEPERAAALAHAGAIRRFATRAAAFDVTTLQEPATPEAAAAAAPELDACRYALEATRRACDVKELALLALRASFLDICLKLLAAVPAFGATYPRARVSAAEAAALHSEAARAMCRYDAARDGLVAAALDLLTELLLYPAGKHAAAARKGPTQSVVADILVASGAAPVVRANAAGALAALLVIEAGKAQALKEGTPAALLAVVNQHGRTHTPAPQPPAPSAPPSPGAEVPLIRIAHPPAAPPPPPQLVDDATLSLTCRAIGILAELPAARLQLLPCLPTLDAIAAAAFETVPTTGDSAALFEGATRARKAVAWTPGADSLNHDEDK